MASPRTVGLSGLTAWMGVSLSGRGGARIGRMPEVAGREAGTCPLRVCGTQNFTLQKLQMPSGVGQGDPGGIWAGNSIGGQKG